ncbi:MAG: hypothetical protein NVSMB18_30270 [Acetobacteraceae bacterium]
MQAIGDPPQPLLGFRTNQDWQELVAQASTMIEALEAIADDGVRAQVFQALEAIDAIHREALHRLVRLFKQGVLEQVVTDPAIRTLMGMYDLLPPEQPGCAKIWDFMPEPEPEPEPVAVASPEDPPHWTPAPLVRPPADGEALVCQFDEGPVVVAQVRGEVFAAEAGCPHHARPMLTGRLSNYTWVCPHGEGCIYDIRSGARLGGGPGLACRPVRRDERGRLMVGFGIPFEPRLPAF